MKHKTLVTLAGLFLTGCSSKPIVEQPPPRAVSYVSLALSEPGAGSRLTGTVESWKREDIGFEVPGRVLRIVEPGIDIEGRTFDEKDNLLSEGTVLAELDPERYLIAERQAQTAADAARTELEQVIPQQLAEAEAALALADKELQRFTNLVRDQSAPQQALDQAESSQTAASAKVAQVNALRATKAVLLNTSLATVEQAQLNLANCKLTSPFTGQIARVHVIPGAYALPGQPVVTVQMMDPMKIQVAVSPQTDKRVNFNDRVRVYLPDASEPLEGYVYLKDTYADPATRTFLVTLLVRNRKVEVGVPKELINKSIPKTQQLRKLYRAKVGKPGNYFVEVNAIREDGEGSFVWKVENLRASDLFDEFDPVLTVKKVRVKLGEGRIPLLQVFTARELTDIGDLDPDNDVIVGATNGQVEDGGQIVLMRERWLLRPGDIVQVGLRGKETPMGFYVPETAIYFDGERAYIHAIRDTDDGAQVVERIEVQAADSYGDLRRIEALRSKELSPGIKIVVEGAQYVADGETVNVVEEFEVKP